MVWSDNGSFQDQTKPEHNKEKEKEKNNFRDDKEFWEYIYNIFNFLTISSQPHKLWTVSLVGGGLVLGCLLGLRSKAPGASLLGLQGIKPHSLLTLWGVVRPRGGVGNWIWWMARFLLGKLEATWSCALPSNTLVAPGSPASLCARPPAVLQTRQSGPKVWWHKRTQRTLSSTMWEAPVRPSPPSSGHPAVLRADLPDTALCWELGWASGGAWAELPAALDVAVP